MSKIAPINAQISFETIDRHCVVVKTYRSGARFNALQEYQAYLKLIEFLQEIDGVRVAKIIKFSPSQNQLTIEKINVPTLQEDLKRGNVSSLRKCRNRLMSVFLQASLKELKFDSDPTNIFFDGNDIVIIDPICQDIDIDDYTFVVFVWGIIKIIVRSWKLWNAPKLIAEVKRLVQCYSKKINRPNDDIIHQIIKYIDIVIEWNRERNQVEGILMYFFRKIVVVPIYRVIQLILIRI